MTGSQGVVLSVDATPLGSELAAIANVGDTALTVTDAAAFYASTAIALNGAVYTFDPSLINDGASTITLGTPVTIAGAVGDSVQAWDVSANTAAVIIEASVAEGELGGEPLILPVSPALVPFLPLGARLGNGDAEEVQIEPDAHGRLWVDKILGRASQVTITAGTIQTADSGERWVISSPADAANELLGYSGDANEYAPGAIYSASDPAGIGISMQSASHASRPGSIAGINLRASATSTSAGIAADSITLVAASATEVLSLDSTGIAVGGGTPLSCIQTGIVSIGTIAASGSTIINVTFANAYPVSHPPTVTASQDFSSWVNTCQVTLNQNLAGTLYTGFSMTIRNLQTSSTAGGNLHWIAIG